MNAAIGVKIASTARVKVRSIPSSVLHALRFYAIPRRQCVFGPHSSCESQAIEKCVRIKGLRTALINFRWDVSCVLLLLGIVEARLMHMWPIQRPAVTNRWTSQRYILPRPVLHQFIDSRRIVGFVG